MYDVAVKQFLIGLQRFRNLLLILYNRINRSAQLFSDYLGKWK